MFIYGKTVKIKIIFFQNILQIETRELEFGLFIKNFYYLNNYKMVTNIFN